MKKEGMNKDIEEEEKEEAKKGQGSQSPQTVRSFRNQGGDGFSGLAEGEDVADPPLQQGGRRIAGEKGGPKDRLKAGATQALNPPSHLQQRLGQIQRPTGGSDGQFVAAELGLFPPPPKEKVDGGTEEEEALAEGEEKLVEIVPAQVMGYLVVNQGLEVAQGEELEQAGRQ
jgi:hypothetical protein